MEHDSTTISPSAPSARSSTTGEAARTGRRRRVVAGGLVAALVASAAAVAPGVLASADGSPVPLRDRVAPEFAERGELGGLTLDELADELADLGLELTIGPIGADRDPSVDQPGEAPDDVGDDEAVGAFPVDGDRIDVSRAATAEVAAQATEIWERFTAIIPADQRRMVSSFELVAEDFGGAYVYQDEDDPQRWILGVGLGLGDALDEVLIHEFAHLLTLRASELPPETAGDPSCPTFDPGEGCALSDSTLAEFVARFWSQEQIDLVDELAESEDDAGLDDFYEANRDDFVTEYAAINPVEDLAETFTAFVLDDRPTGDTIADQKVLLLWDDPELVELRREIRARL